MTIISTQLPGCRRVLLVLFQTDFIQEIFLFNNKCISLLADTDNRETFLVRPNFHHSFYIGISIDLRTLEIHSLAGWLVRILVPLKKKTYSAVLFAHLFQQPLNSFEKVKYILKKTSISTVSTKTR